MCPWKITPPIRIEIPGTPRALERNRHRIAGGKSGAAFVQTYLPQQSREWQAVLGFYATQAMVGKEPLLEDSIDLRCCFFLPIPKSWTSKKRTLAIQGRIKPIGKPDLDNLGKMIDAFKGIVWRDDAQVTTLFATKQYSENPRTEFEIRASWWFDLPAE